MALYNGDDDDDDDDDKVEKKRVKWSVNWERGGLPMVTMVTNMNRTERRWLNKTEMGEVAGDSRWLKEEKKREMTTCYDISKIHFEKVTGARFHFICQLRSLASEMRNIVWNIRQNEEKKERLERIAYTPSTSEPISKAVSSNTGEVRENDGEHKKSSATEWISDGRHAGR